MYLTLYFITHVFCVDIAIRLPCRLCCTLLFPCTAQCCMCSSFLQQVSARLPLLIIIFSSSPPPPPPPVPLFILLDHVFSVEENFRKYLPERGDNNRWVISINSLNWLKSTCQFDATLMTLGLVINFTDYPPANASNRKQDVNEGGFDSLCSDTSKPDKTIACHI